MDKSVKAISIEHISGQLTSIFVQEIIGKRIDILAEPNFLSDIFYRILVTRNIDPPKLEEAIKKYIQAEYPSHYPFQTKNMFRNIRNELARPPINWRVFSKGLTILQYVD